MMRAVLLVLFVACAPIRPGADGAPLVEDCVEFGRDGERSLRIWNGCAEVIVCEIDGDASWGPVEIEPDDWWATPATVGVPGDYVGECETAAGPVAWEWPAP